MNFVTTILNSSAPDEKIALFTQQGDVTYAQLHKEVRRIAGFLKTQGLKPGERVLLAGDSSAFWVFSYLGIALAGGVIVPVAMPSTPEHLKEIVNTTKPHSAFVQAKLLRRFDPKLLKECILIVSDFRPPNLNPELSIVTTAEMKESKHQFPDIKIDDMASIMFTSGSTATPRGVMVSHRNIISNTEDIITSLGIKASDRIMAILPFHYCFGASLLHTHLCAGASIVIDNRFLFPEKVLLNLAESECTSLAGVPSTFQILLRRSNFKKMDFPHLKIIQQAGGKLAQHFIDELELALPHAQIFIMYGQTEATARLSCISPENRKNHPGSIGTGLDHVNLKVIGGSGMIVKPGEIGEIVATGPNITLGYWQDKEASSHIFKNGLHTGDLATVDGAGYIMIVDRARDFLKCGGKRVSSKQIEESLLQFDGVSEVAVVGIPDIFLGEAVCLFVVHSDGKTIEDKFRKFCDINMDHSLLPKQIFFMDELPQTSSGKPDKQALKKLLGSINL